MKPFDLEAAKAGAPVCTREGHSVRIVCWDVKDPTYPIIALINDDDHEIVIDVTERGFYYEDNQETSKYDLFMAAEEEHYDISNFKPFDKVLVRDNEAEQWCASFFSHCEIDERVPFSIPFVAVSRAYYQCIPYNEETAHLVGTIDMPPKKYINW